MIKYKQNYFFERGHGMKDGHSGHGLAFAALRGAVVFIFFLGLSKLTSFSIKALSVIGSERDLFKSLPNWAIYLTCTVGAILIYNSFASSFSVYDRRTRNEFIEAKADGVRFLRNIKAIISSPKFITEAAASISLVAIVSLAGAFPEVGGIFFSDGSQNAGFFPALILSPICFIELLLAKYEALRYWHKLEREKDIEKLDTPHRFILRIAVVVVLYPTIFPFSPLLVFIIWSFISVIVGVTNAIGVISAIAAVLMIILLVLCISLLAAMSKRKKFIKALLLIAVEKGYTVSKITHPYSCFLASSKRCGFILEAEGKKYDCVIISTLHRTTPLIFASPTDAYFRHRIGTKNHHFTVNHNVEFYPTGEGKQLVIVNPMPKNRVFIEDGPIGSQVISGDKLWGFILYDGTSFLSALERECLGRENGE